MCHPSILSFISECCFLVICCKVTDQGPIEPCFECLCVAQDDVLSLIQPGLQPTQQYFSSPASANARNQPAFVPKHSQRGAQWTSHLADIKPLDSQAGILSLSNGTLASKADAPTMKEPPVPRMAEALKQVGLILVVDRNPCAFVRPQVHVFLKLR